MSLYFSVVPGIVRKQIITILPLGALGGRTNAAEEGCTEGASTRNPGRGMLCVWLARLWKNM